MLFSGATVIKMLEGRALLPAGRLQQLCRHLAGEGVIDEGAFEWREVEAGIKAFPPLARVVEEIRERYPHAVSVGAQQSAERTRLA